jgi:nucleotide-binding universal stress UspA family protein
MEVGYDQLSTTRRMRVLSSPNILVCTDFKQTSDFALKSAETIRKKVGGKIYVIHISDIPVNWDWVGQESSFLLNNEKLTADLLKSLKKMMADQIRRCEVDCTTDVSVGPTYEGIMESIKKKKPDLVLMGHKGHSHEVFSLGGIASKVVASAHVPVLVIKKLLYYPLGKVAGLVETTENMKPIILATEEFSFLLSAQAEVISLWKNVTSQFYNLAPVEKVHPLLDLRQEVKDAILNKIRTEITEDLDEHTKCRVRVEITEEKQVAYHLVKILEEDLVDLVIMKRHQRKLIEKIFIGSETRRMLEIFNGNVLVLPP